MPLLPPRPATKTSLFRSFLLVMFSTSTVGGSRGSTSLFIRAGTPSYTHIIRRSSPALLSLFADTCSFRNYLLAREGCATLRCSRRVNQATGEPGSKRRLRLEARLRQQVLPAAGMTRSRIVTPTYASVCVTANLFIFYTTAFCGVLDLCV